MTSLRRVLVPFVAAAVGAAGAVAYSSSASSASTPAAPPTYSLTVAGTDMHSLDPHLEPMFVPGGGVMETFEKGAASATYPALEATLSLPVGAKITSLQFAMANCGSSIPQLAFGSYQPATGSIQETVVIGLTHNCAHKTTTKTGSPITTVAAGRRYAIDYLPNSGYAYPGDASVENVFYGATVKYTCTSPCVP